MQRYFLEVAYDGTRYSGFQIQENAVTIQSTVESALTLLLKEKFELTGSSRTDAGVHAYQNYFHFDSLLDIPQKKLYNLNAILPSDVVAKNIYKVAATAHCRFDAIYRRYQYFIATQKNPFVIGKAWHYPFTINTNILHQCANIVLKHTNFEAFSKKNTQVKTFNCTIHKSSWTYSSEQKLWVYEVQANRFLRGMVKGLVSTMLLAARGKITLQQFEEIIVQKKGADFTAPSEGLFLCEVGFEKGYFKNYAN